MTKPPHQKHFMRIDCYPVPATVLRHFLALPRNKISSINIMRQSRSPKVCITCKHLTKRCSKWINWREFEIGCYSKGEMNIFISRKHQIYSSIHPPFLRGWKITNLLFLLNYLIHHKFTQLSDIRYHNFMLFYKCQSLR